MMYDVKAPDGYQGVVQWIESAHAWQAAARRVGHAYFTKCGCLIGHASTPIAEVTRYAETAIAVEIQGGGIS